MGSQKNAASSLAPLDVAGVRRNKIGSRTSAVRGILVASPVMVSHLIHAGSGHQKLGLNVGEIVRVSMIAHCPTGSWSVSGDLTDCRKTSVTSSVSSRSSSLRSVRSASSNLGGSSVSLFLSLSYWVSDHIQVTQQAMGSRVDLG